MRLNGKTVTLTIETCEKNEKRFEECVNFLKVDPWQQISDFVVVNKVCVLELRYGTIDLQTIKVFLKVHPMSRHKSLPLNQSQKMQQDSAAKQPNQPQWVKPLFFVQISCGFEVSSPFKNASRSIFAFLSL